MRLFYLTMRHAATSVQSLPVKSSGRENCWQGLKDRRTSVSTGTTLPAATGFKRPRKPSASSIAFRFITPLPFSMMHLQLLTLKQPAFLADLPWEEAVGQNRPKQTDSVRKTALGIIMAVWAAAMDRGELCAVRYLKCSWQYGEGRKVIRVKVITIPHVPKTL